MKLLIGLCACYLLLVFAVYLLQRRMLYFPSVAGRDQTAQAAAQRGLTLWPEHTVAYQGLVSVSPPSSFRGTVVVWHGNGGSALHRAHYVYALERLGFHVVLVEYPGYGARPGTPGESVFVSSGLQAARRAEESFGGPLYVWGESLGCGIASAVAADSALDVRGAVMLTPWDRLPDLAQRLYPYLPARWLVRDRYDNIANLQSFHGRVAVLVAEEDEVIPRVHTMRLYESISSEKRLWVFAAAGHNAWPTSPSAAWWAEVMAWLSGP